jgi:hypothetical protein
MEDSQAQLGIGSVGLGTIESMKPYGAFIDIGGINGLFHVSQISHDRVADISIVLQPGHNLKVLATITRLKVVESFPGSCANGSYARLWKTVKPSLVLVQLAWDC